MFFGLDPGVAPHALATMTDAAGRATWSFVHSGQGGLSFPAQALGLGSTAGGTSQVVHGTRDRESRPLHADAGRRRRARRMVAAMASELRVALVEDHARTREGLAQLIGGTPGFRVTGAWGSMEAALQALPAAVPDVLLADIGLPGMSGIEGVARIKERLPQVQILMLSVYGDDDSVFAAICAGASGYLLKDTPPQRLLEAIAELHAGGAPMSPEVARRVVQTFRKVAPAREDHRLTERELAVLQLLVDGHSYKTAAARLEVALDTIRFHVRNIYDKLHVHSKSAAVAAALRRGIVGR
jgi:DNA-binding NarL/FixJ family response regulator